MLTAYLDGLRESLMAFVRYADRAGLRAPVPSCPGWKVRHLIAHQGRVHRWASAQLRGVELDITAVERVGMNAEDPVDWLREGALELAKVIVNSPEDVPGPTFLADPQPPRAAWARRMCHETTIHAVDAMAAALGRAPIAAEADWIDEELALDGIDELLTGFLPRRAKGVTQLAPSHHLVVPDGADRGWRIHLEPGAAQTIRVTGDELEPAEGDEVLRGSGVAAYLGLWNRSGDPLPAGWERWAEQVRV